MASNNQHGQLIVDYLNDRTRRDIRESVLKGLDKTPAVIANTIKLANACAPATREYVDPQLNSIRFNLLKTLVGVEGRDTLIDRDLKVTGHYWKNVKANVAAEGLTKPYIDDQNGDERICHENCSMMSQPLSLMTKTPKLFLKARLKLRTLEPW